MTLVGFTGFGPFPGVADNASAHLARMFEERSGADVRVLSTVLPVEFDAVGGALERHFDGLGPRPDLLLATGVHRGETLRLERRARRAATSEKPDAAGRVGAGNDLDPSWPESLETEVDLDLAERALGQPDAPAVSRSEDAGGYLCERVCYLTLRRAAAIGVPGLFVHVPGIERRDPATLVAPFEALVRALTS